VVSRRELARLAARGCPTHPDRACDCPLLDAPPAVDRYRPSTATGGFSAPGTAPAAIPAATPAPSGPTWTTSCRTPRAEPPTAPTCAACAAGITG
jgi:hypothetical protein